MLKKSIILFMYGAFLILNTGCGSDSCTFDFSGTYTGNNDCSLTGNTEGVTVTITGEPGAYKISGLGLTVESLDQNGCKLTGEEVLLGTGEKVVVTQDGDNGIKVVTTLTAVGVQTSKCTFTGTK